MGDLAVNLSIKVIKVGVFVYDILTYPLYAIANQPWKNCDSGNLLSKPVKTSEGVCYRSTREETSLQKEIKDNDIDTLAKFHEFSCHKYGDKKGFGTRKIIKEFSEKQPNGKVFKKYEMEEFYWKTYSEVEILALQFGRGLRTIGHKPKENLVIFAETRVEWLIAAMGMFKQSIPVCTLYATLGEEALIHGINETEVRRIVVSHELMPKLKSILKQCPKIEAVIYFPDQLVSTETTGFGPVTVYSYNDIIEKGKRMCGPDASPCPNDTAIIMYTSGSTGMAKGVVMSHSNMVHSVTAFAVLMDPSDTDIAMAFLPLAHVLELISESIMMIFGIPIGYSNPLTMTDRSTKVKRGCKGDISALNPTYFPSVPLILDRIYKGILDKVASQGPFLKVLFQYGLEYKMNWGKKGWGTPFCDWIVFRKIRALLGGNVRIIAVGGAPLAPETHDFVRFSLGCTVVQGYGLTETCGCATLMDLGDSSTGRVGVPLPGVDIKLVDWDEGNYRVTDKPNPRGEIIVGGKHVTVGYYKNVEKTDEEYYEMDGKRWFRTGDIGEIEPDGALKIIDRKKDLVKLQTGEYVSLGKVEAALKVCPLVENLCVYAESAADYIVTIMVPDHAKLKAVAKKLGKDEEKVEKLCQDKDVVHAVLKQLTQVAKDVKLGKFEIPTALYITPEPWTPDTGLVTAAFKLKRKPIQDKFQAAIDMMYGR